MDSLERCILFETAKGNQYRLSFIPYETEKPIKIPIIEISLDILHKKSETNSMNVFGYVTNEIKNFLLANDVILYYYCDSSDIYYRNNKKRNFTSPQHFRSVFFNSLFEKADLENVFIKNFTIYNPTQSSSHYISFIFKKSNKQDVEQLFQELEKYRNK